MHFRKSNAELSVLEAVDNLSHMAEVDLSTAALKEQAVGLTEQQIGERLHALSWHDPEYYAYNRERIKETFRALLKYLQDFYEKDKGHLKEEETQRGIQAIMLLVTEAAQKVDEFTKIFEGEKGVTEIKEYKELQHFYLTKVVQRFQTILEEKEKWQDEWGSGSLEGEIQGLESIRRDREYELFYLRKQDGKPFFNRALLRHIQWVGKFGTLFSDPTKENLSVHIRSSMDKDVHASAKEILHLASAYVDDYFKEAMKYKQMGFVAATNKALMALMLAADTRNLMGTAIGKSCLDYYADFHDYLRAALNSQECKRFLSNPPDQDQRFFNALVNVSHVLCTSFFLRVGSRKEMIAFIHLLIDKGSRGGKIESQTASPLALWNNLLDEDNSIRFLLKQYPNGPLKKTLKMFNEDTLLQGFDPIAQQNLPSQMYTFIGEEIHVTCLRLPSPTVQKMVNKADVIDEFYGFLRSLKNQRHLLINLQDRTSSREYARCHALEETSKKRDFVTVTMAKNGDFYDQSGNYLTVNDAEEFMRQLRDQIASAEQCGFHFPPEIDQKELLKFSEAAIKTIHTVFFARKDLLVHKNRLDFIEIFYCMLTVKLIEMFQPDTLSLTCKDAVDTGAIASAELFAFLRMTNDPSNWSKQEKDFLLWMLYAPALAVRERAIDLEQLTRMISAIEIIAAEVEAHHHETVNALAKLYKLPFFKNLKVRSS